MARILSVIGASMLMFLGACTPNGGDGSQPETTPAPADDRETEPVSEETLEIDLSELFLAIDAGDISKVEALIKAQPERAKAKNSLSPYKHTPLLEALDKEKLDIALLLLKNGANPFTMSTIGLNSLHFLAMVMRDVTPAKQELKLELYKTIRRKKGLKAAINQSQGDGRRAIDMVATYSPSFTTMQPLADMLYKDGAQPTSELLKRLALDKPKNYFEFFEKLYPEYFKNECKDNGVNLLKESITHDNAAGFDYFVAQGITVPNNAHLWLLDSPPQREPQIADGTKILRRLVAIGLDKTAQRSARTFKATVDAWALAAWPSAEQKAMFIAWSGIIGI